VVAVVANEPYLTGSGNVRKAASERPLGKIARLLVAAVADKMSELLAPLFALPPVYVKLVGSFNELAILSMVGRAD
jgi:hypothetical protein